MGPHFPTRVHDLSDVTQKQFWEILIFYIKAEVYKSCFNTNFKTILENIVNQKTAHSEVVAISCNREKWIFHRILTI